jgi:pyruvate/2-oxoglutarate dehydrogenase complex dihydrolipoamide dehydrogenase (E3) component
MAAARPPRMSAGPAASDDWLGSLGAAFRAGVVTKDRKHRLTTYKNCFVGREAVDWLVAARHAKSRADAVRLGRALAEVAFFEHVTRDHQFADDHLFFHFVDETARGAAARRPTGEPVRWADFLDPATATSSAGSAASGPSLAPRIPLPDFDAVPAGDVHVASQMWPLDRHNAALLDNVHPPLWEDAHPDGPSGQSSYTLVVIGAGAGGLVTAAGAAGVGARVALIEANLLGGDCLNMGCVPSKALIHSANLAHTLRGDMAHLADSGISIDGGAAAVTVDFAKTMERLRRLRAEISENDSAERFTRKLGVDVFFGWAAFTSDRTVAVNGRTLEFKRAVIATGGYPALPPMAGLADLYEAANRAKDGDVRPAVMTNETFFNLTARPSRLAVIGAGVCGMELAQAMQRLGSRVTVFGRSGRVLPKEDEDLAHVVKDQMVRDGVHFRLSVAEYKSVRLTGAVLHSGLPELALTVVEDQEGDRVEVEVRCDALLVAAGRKPNVTGMDLEKAGVEYDSKAGLAVTDGLQTTNPRVFGVGDCCSAFKFTHVADFMARMVIRNALFLGREKMSSLLVPWATFTSPEIASVGLHEGDLVERGIAFHTFEKRFADNDRAICDGAPTGMVRVRVDAKTDTILGASIVGAGAGNLISEVTLAMQSGTGLGKLAAVIHPYPTTAESIRQAGDLYNRGRLTTTVRGVLRGLIKIQR